MVFSCQNKAIGSFRSNRTPAESGRFDRLFQARGLWPVVRVRPLRTGEGRPRCGAIPAALCAALFLTVPSAAARAGEAVLPDWAQFEDARVEIHAGQGEGREERWLVMRWLVPAIARDGGSMGYEDVAAGMDALCNGPGLETARGHESPVSQIVVTLMDRVVEWGRPAPEATQFIASYAVTEAGCEWQ